MNRPKNWRKEPLETWQGYLERHQIKVFGIGFLMVFVV